MSLSKDNPIEVKSDSFSYRFGDDLSEEILQYLPLEDKLRLEEVSKQFQRTVFERLFDLDIRVYSDWDLKNLDEFLKKRSKLNSINKIEVAVTEGHNQSDKDIVKVVYNQLIELIVKNCHNLSQINFFWDSISDENREIFVEKFNSKIVCLSVGVDSPQEVFNSFVNIQELNVKCNRMGPQLFQYKNLKKLILYTVDETVVSFLDNHKTSLKHLSLVLDANKGQNHIEMALDAISRLDQLIELNITFISWVDVSSSIDEALNQLAVNCLKLKSISIWFGTDSYVRYMSDILSPLEQFKALRRLKLTIQCHPLFYSSFCDYCFENFNDFKALEYLKLSVEDIKSLTYCPPILLTDIDINLPNLRYLEINNGYIEANETTIEMLSRLSSLESIKLSVENRQNGYSLIRGLTQNCTRIRIIEISESFELNVSQMAYNYAFDSDNDSDNDSDFD